MLGAMTLPHEVSEHRGIFDRFADFTERYVSRSWFFALCVAVIVVWAPTILFWPLDLWQLSINTPSTIVTWLLVALLTNSGRRSNSAVQHKFNAVVAYLAATAAPEHADHATELRAAVGLEQRESSED